jgi:hypothetical protein
MEKIKVDWRRLLYTETTAETFIPWTQHYIAPGTVLTLVKMIKLNKNKKLSMPIPSATALFLSMSKKSYFQAKKIIKNSGIEQSIKKEVSFPDESDLFDYLENIINSVVSAYSAIEAFVNEALIDFSENGINEKELHEIERKPTIDKIKTFLPKSLSILSPTRERCYTDFIELQKIRNKIIHLKKIDRISGDTEIKTVWDELFRCLPPHEVAYDIINYFYERISEEKKPYWLLHYDNKKISN